MAHWEKLGLLIDAGAADWLVSHVAVPIVEHRSGGTHRMYFTTRDEAGRSRVGTADFDIADPFGTISVCDAPVLGPGPAGAFDERGAMASSLVAHDGRTYLYYVGWSIPPEVPFVVRMGLALSDNGGADFTRHAADPILPLDAIDPISTSSAFVLRDQGRWRMWYISIVRWEPQGAGAPPRHYYNIRHADSDDGIAWRRDGTVCIDFKNRHEYAISTPCVVRDPDCYRMWYSYRASPGVETYRIGYAESDDGLAWRRLDEHAGIDVSEAGWDSQAVCYPCVFDAGAERYMAYNGNDYGRTGVGLAVLRR